MTTLIGQYPGPYGMMMNRLGWGTRSGWNMMSGWNGMMGWGFGFWSWVFVLSWFVWTAAGVLLVVWLFKKSFSVK